MAPEPRCRALRWPSLAEYGPGATYSNLALVYSCSCKASVIARTECVLHASVLQATEREVFRAPKVLAAAHALRVGRGEQPALQLSLMALMAR